MLKEAWEDLTEEYSTMSRSAYPTAQGVIDAILDGRIRHVEIKF